MTKLGDLAVEVNAMLGNRTDVLTYTTFPTVSNMADTDRMAGWFKDAYNELAMGYRFEELCQEVDDVMVVNADVYQLPTGATRFIRAVTLIYPSGPRPIRRRHIRNIRRHQTSSLGPPSIYAPFNPGGQPSIIVRSVPDQGYPFIWDVQMKPTFANTIAATVVNLPDDWLDILKWCTALRGHAALQEFDKAGAMRELIYGGIDPASGRKMPGQIKQRTSARDQLDIEDTEYGLQPQLRRYCNSK